MPTGFPKNPFYPHYLANTNEFPLAILALPCPYPSQLLPNWEHCKLLKGGEGLQACALLWTRSDQ